MESMVLRLTWKRRPSEIIPGIKCLVINGAAVAAAVAAPTAAGYAAASSSPSLRRTNPKTTVTGAASLWEQALDKIRAKGQGYLDEGEECDILLVRRIIDEIDQKKRECDEKRWFYINDKGEKVFFVETLLRQLNKYALIGDLAIQHHPDIVALAWAGFRFLLQVGTAYTENMRAVSESLDYVVRTLCCCDIYEKLYCARKLEIAEVLNTSLVNLYASILEYLCYAKQYLQQNTSTRILKSFFSELGLLLDDVRKKEKEVECNARIAEKEVSAVGRFNQEERTKQLRRLLGKIQKPIQNIELVVEEIYTNIQGERRSKILVWISDVKFSSHHSSSSGRRQSNTCHWLLENEKFSKWRNSVSSSVLLLRGDAGSGKTILASFVIDEFREHAMSNEHVLAYFYCDYKQAERREPASVLRTLVKQFCLKNPGDLKLFPKLVLSAYEKREKNGHSSDSLSLNESRDLIVNLSEGYLQTTIVIDALDECDRKTRRVLFSILHDIVTSTNRVKILLTSRYDSDIEEIFTNFPNHSINASDNSKDINMYINTEIERRCDPQKRSGAEKLLLNGNVDPKLKSKIISTLQSKADGMFMWVNLQILALCDEHTPGGIEKALNALPKDLEATYLQIFKQIDSQSDSSKLTAKAVLAWLLHAQEPCSAASVIQALAVKPGKNTLDEDGLNWTLPKILSICQNLVVQDEKLQTLRFVHFSVQEFLLHNPEFYDWKAHVYMAEVCLTALTYHNSETESSPIPDLICYSVSNWGAHVRLSGVGTSTLQMLWRGFLQPSPVYKAWGSKASKRTHDLRGKALEIVPPLWTACYYQLYDISKYLLESAEDLNACNYEDKTPLFWAAEHGHERMVQLLLEKDGVDADFKAEGNRTPLSSAAAEGHEKVVQLLLGRNGVDVNHVENHYAVTPLLSAAYKGHMKVVQVLLENDRVNVNPKTPQGRTPLFFAARDGNEKVVQLLLEKYRVDVNSIDEGNRTPLSSAAEFGQKKVVQLLLEKEGVDVNSKDNNNRTPLSWAAGKGQEEVVQLLLEKDGVDVDSKDSRNRTPLSWAAQHGDEKVVRLLLDKDRVDLHSKDNDNWTPLSWAAAYGHVEVMRLLLEKDGVDINPKCLKGRTPLALAALNGQEKAVQFLLEKDGVDVDSKDSRDLSPLSLAAKSGHEEVVQLLLEKDVVDVNSKDQDNRTPLSLAAESGQEEVVQLLLEKNGVDVNSRSLTGQTPLFWAAQNGHEKVVQLLLDTDGVDADSKDLSDRTPLSYAVEKHHINISQILEDFLGRSSRANLPPYSLIKPMM